MSNWLTPGQGPFFPQSSELSKQVKLYRVETPGEFGRVVFFSQAYSEQRNDTHETAILAYVSAAPLQQINPELPWDAECAAYDPLLYDHVLAVSESLQKNVILIHVIVDPYTFHLADNPWRSNPKLQIRQLPTLLRWQTSRFTHRLVGAAVIDQQLLRSAVEDDSPSTAGLTYYRYNSAVASSINDLDRLLYDVSYNHSIDFTKTPVLLWSVLETDPATGESRCGDVRKSTPILQSTLQSLEQHVVIIKIEVQRSEWNKPLSENIYKQHPTLQLTKLPTLQRYWQGSTIGWSVVEGANFDGEHIAALITETKPSNHTTYFKVQSTEGPADFEKLMKAVEEHNKRQLPILVYAVSAKEKDLGDGHLVPWCPYVRLSSPIFHKTLADSGQQYIVIIIDVKLEGYRDAAVNQWRSYQPLSLQFVPTAWRWDGTGKPIQRAVVGAAVADVKKLTELLQPHGAPIFWHRVLENELYVNHGMYTALLCRAMRHTCSYANLALLCFRPQMIPRTQETTNGTSITLIAFVSSSTALTRASQHCSVVRRTLRHCWYMLYYLPDTSRIHGALTVGFRLQSVNGRTIDSLTNLTSYPFWSCFSSSLESCLEACAECVEATCPHRRGRDSICVLQRLEHGAGWRHLPPYQPTT